MPSRTKALTKAIPIKAMTTENGSAPIIIAVLIAANPSPFVSSRPAITRVRIMPYVMIWTRPFGLSSPAAAIVLMIKTAESADVTKYVISKITIKSDIKVANVGESMKLIIANNWLDRPAPVI